MDPRPTTQKKRSVCYTAHSLINASLTSASFARATDDQYNRALSGAKSDVAQWQRCVWRTGSDVGMAVGRLFVDSVFGVNSKNVAEDMVFTVLQAFEGTEVSLRRRRGGTYSRSGV